MPHQDHGSSASALGPTLDWLVRSESFGSYTLRRDSVFTPARLVKLVLLWAWSESATLTDRFAHAQEVTASPAGDQHRSVTYQAFVKLLRRHSAPLLDAVVKTLQQHVRESLADSYRVAGYLVFGVDGTRVATPRTLANQAAFESPPKRRSGKPRTSGVPQAWLTTLWHVGSGLPWGWRTGPGDSSERRHLRELLAWLPERSLLTADAGYIGYDLCQAIHQSGHDFLLRVGGNAKLLRKLGWAREDAGRVYLWPQRAAKKRLPPIVLRLIVVQDAKSPVYLVTTVLMKKELSDRQLVELYRRRWGIEVFYRGFKRTFARHKLHSASPENAMLELDWSLAALWAACLYAKVQQGGELTRTSVAGVLRVIRRAMRNAGGRIEDELANALVDDYQRQNKASRDYPCKKSNLPGDQPPILVDANHELIIIAQQIRGFGLLPKL